MKWDGGLIMHLKNDKKLQIWISKTRKEVLFSKRLDKNFECIEFKKYEELMDYVKACISCGYKVG